MRTGLCLMVQRLQPESCVDPEYELHVIFTCHKVVFLFSHLKMEKASLLLSPTELGRWRLLALAPGCTLQPLIKGEDR